MNLRLLFDRSFSTSYFKQLVWLFAFVVLLLGGMLLLGLIPGMYEIAESETSERGYFSDVLLLFLDSTNYNNGMSTTFILVVGIIGVFMFHGLLVSVVTNMLNRRVALYNLGAVRYNLKNHLVIIGQDATLPALINRLCSAFPGRNIVIMTKEEIASTRAFLMARLNEKNFRRVILYSGSSTEPEDLRSLRLSYCQSLYVLGERHTQKHDSQAIECLNKVAQILDERKATMRLTCYVKFQSSSLYSAFQYADISSEVKQHIHFLPYNVEDVWAKKIVVYNEFGYPIDGAGIDASSPKHVHLFVLGMDNMGISFALQAARIAHFPNYQVGNPNTQTVITFVDAEEKFAPFKQQYASLLNLSEQEDFLDIRWEFMTNSRFVPYLNECALDPNALISIVVCGSDSEQNLDKAIHLGDAVYTSPSLVQILVQQHQSDSFVKLLSDAPSSKFAKLVSFGQVGDLYSTELVPEAVGKCVNACYCGIEMDNAEAVEEAWNRCSVAQKWSSIFSADMLNVRLRSLGLSRSSSVKEIEDAVNAHLQEMMSVEHNRWNMEKLLGGFRSLTEEEVRKIKENPALKKQLKSSPYYAHIDICSLETLKQRDPDTLVYDADVLKAIPYFVSC